MLRWLFLILLLLNGVLFGWFYQEQQRRERAVARIDMPVHGVAALELLSEVPASALRSRPDQDAEAVGVSLPLGPVEQLVESEDDAELSPRFCYRIGPFEQAQGLEPWLGDGHQGQLRLEQQQVGIQSPSYQVYVSAAADSSGRDELLRSMRSVGLEGEWVSEGAFAGKLLLGAYQAQGAALALEQALNTQGYDAAVSEQAEPIYRYYLLLERADELTQGEGWLVSLLKNYPVAKSEKKPCQGLATSQGRE